MPEIIMKLLGNKEGSWIRGEGRGKRNSIDGAPIGESSAELREMRLEVDLHSMNVDMMMIADGIWLIDRNYVRCL